MNCEIIFWDVQHGHAAYIKTPNNRHLVIDLGTGSYGFHSYGDEFSPLLCIKEKFGVNKLDCVVVTHPHKDHIDDILNFEKLSPRIFKRPRHLSHENIEKDVREQDKDKFQKYVDLDNRYVHTVSDSNILSKPDNYGGLEIDFFTPKSCPQENLNNQSIVTVIQYASTKIVIPGDNESCSFDELMKQSSFKKAVKNADILLAPHHGRKSGYNSEFVDLVSPKLTIVSDGRFCDTSYNGTYSSKSSGWTVHKRDGTKNTRYCLTTNSDGDIYASFGPGQERPFLKVMIN